jgi:hypothetical protein
MTRAPHFYPTRRWMNQCRADRIYSRKTIARPEARSAMTTHIDLLRAVNLSEHNKLGWLILKDRTG